ncbi:hypothetical protein H8959_007007 [Pygathrix nigripes]
MEDGVAGPRLVAAAEAAEARARPGVTLRPFAPLSGPADADEGGGDWSFIDCEMEEVDLQDLPSATIACHLDPRVFVDGLCRSHPKEPGAYKPGGLRESKPAETGVPSNIAREGCPQAAGRGLQESSLQLVEGPESFAPRASPMLVKDLWSPLGGRNFMCVLQWSLLVDLHFISGIKGKVHFQKGEVMPFAAEKLLL